MKSIVGTAWSYLFSFDAIGKFGCGKLIVLLALLLCTAATARSQGGTLDDGFTTPQPQIWNEEGNEPGAGTVNYGTQGVVLTLQPGSAARGIASGCSVSGDFDVEVGITLINWPANNLYGVRLGANDLGAGPFGEIGIYREGGSESYTVAFTNGGVHSVTVSADKVNKLRLVRQGGFLTGFYLVNGGASWVQVGGPGAGGSVSTAPTHFNLDVSSSNPNAAGISVAFNNFHVNSGTVQCGCTTNVVKLYQALDNSGMPQRWTCDIYDHPITAQSSRYCPAQPAEIRIAQDGCALTALTMSLNATGLSFDPGTLNNFMLDSAHPYDYGWGDHGVAFGTTVSDVAKATGKILKWTPFNSSSIQDLQNVVCSANAPVIVGVDLSLNQSHQLVPGHFVVVTGWDGTQFQIADPGYRERTTLLDYNNEFIGRGYVTDPPTARSSLHIAVADAELLLSDPNGLQTGYDVATAQNTQQIPGSAYSRSALIDDETGQAGPQDGYYLDVYQPVEGTYTINVQGLKLEPYTLTIRTFDANGNPDPPLSVVGIEAPGLSQTLNLKYSTLTNAHPTLAANTTFQSTLADIANSRKLGQVVGYGTAKLLEAFIEAAQRKTLQGRDRDANLILENFDTFVRLAATPLNLILGITPQLLEADARSLISQLPQDSRHW